ncbi:MAG: hypothetical protein ACFFCS_09675 [Candidatus Hodarchaeota archaeon]
MGTFFFGHLWVSPVAFLMQTIILIGYIWFPKSRKPEKGYKNKFIQGLRAIPFGLFYFFGLLYVNIFVNIVILGLYPYAAWAQTFPSAIIALVCGIEWMLAGFLVSPNIKSIISCGFITVVYFIFTLVLIPADQNNIWQILDVLIYLAMAYVLHFILTLIEFLLKKFKSGFRGDRKLWDIHVWFKKTFTWKVNFILWIIAFVEGMLSFMGYSLVTIFT